MAGRIPQDFIRELVARTDIVEVIGKRVPLRRAGPRLRGVLPVSRREDAFVHGEPGQTVLSLLRLRRARHRDHVPDGARRHELRRGRGRSRGAGGHDGSARRRARKPRDGSVRRAGACRRAVPARTARQRDRARLPARARRRRRHRRASSASATRRTHGTRC